jgi:quercetin dioxygenase-like cupin family protein
MSYTLIEDISQLMMEIPPDSIVSRTLFDDDQLKAVLFGFAAGQELSEHTASHPAVLHFVQGEALVTFGDDQHEAGPGTWVHMTARLPHSVVARTPLIMLLLLMKRD